MYRTRLDLDTQKLIYTSVFVRRDYPYREYDLSAETKAWFAANPEEAKAFLDNYMRDRRTVGSSIIKWTMNTMCVTMRDIRVCLYNGFMGKF
jgi:hypothetical protein